MHPTHRRNVTPSKVAKRSQTQTCHHQRKKHEEEGTGMEEKEEEEEEEEEGKEDTKRPSAVWRWSQRHIEGFWKT